MVKKKSRHLKAKTHGAHMRIKNPRTGLLCLFVVIIGVCLNLMGCGKDKVSHEVVGFVEGTVIDSLTRLPIDSAWIRINPDTLNPPNTYTNSAGYYFFVRITGMHRFHYCGKRGYITKKTGEYQIRIHQITKVNIELVPINE